MIYSGGPDAVYVDSKLNFMMMLGPELTMGYPLDNPIDSSKRS